MRNSTLKVSAVALAIAGAVGFVTPSFAGGATSAVTKKSPNVFQVQPSQRSVQAARTTGGIEFSSAARTPKYQVEHSTRSR